MLFVFLKCFFTSWSCIFTLVIVLVALVGDDIVSKSKTNWRRALADNITHGVIGLLTWLIIVQNYRNVDIFSQLCEVCVAGCISSCIDIDHFVAAKSLRLTDAVNLSSRPFLHCTSVPFVALIVCIVLCNSFDIINVRFLWILLAAFLSHHIRDSTRRGLWLWPFGATPPVPYCVYILATMFLPHILSFAMIYSYGRIRKHSVTHLDV